MSELVVLIGQINKDKNKAAAFSLVQKDLQAALLADPSYQEVFAAIQLGSVDRPSEPTEYELRLAYREVLSRINELLPDDLKISWGRVLVDPRRALLKKEASEYILKLEASFSERFQNYYKKSLTDLKKNFALFQIPNLRKPST